MDKSFQQKLNIQIHRNRPKATFRLSTTWKLQWTI